MSLMQRVALGPIELEYEIVGAGENVVLVHHGAGADGFTRLLTESALSSRFRLLLSSSRLCGQHPSARPTDIPAGGRHVS